MFKIKRDELFKKETVLLSNSCQHFITAKSFNCKMFPAGTNGHL
ncbi:MAG TPA: hypothetical protein PKG90_07925 [Chitinophagaceae bacterium]|nr:hypothetical protein [Chitinophagaceae bacterium]